MSATPDLRLRLPNHAENVSLVRQALSGMALAVDLEPAVLADVKTAVSEACNNVVIHAYDGESGPLEVDVRVDAGELLVVVRDEGGGIQPHPVESETAVQGVGLSLITALADRVEYLGGPECGTEVHMRFSAEVDRDGIVAAEHEAPRSPEHLAAPDGAALVSVCSGVLAAPVLAAFVGAVAARTLSVERLSDTQLVTDAIAAHGHEAFAGPYLHVATGAADQRLELWVGPLVSGGGEALLRSGRLDGLGEASLFERIADEVSVETAQTGERLHIELATSA